MKNIPKIIYLQIGDDCESDDFNELRCLPGEQNEITWCEDRINDTDIKYILDRPVGCGEKKDG